MSTEISVEGGFNINIEEGFLRDLDRAEEVFVLIQSLNDFSEFDWETKDYQAVSRFDFFKNLHFNDKTILSKKYGGKNMEDMYSPFYLSKSESEDDIIQSMDEFKEAIEDKTLTLALLPNLSHTVDCVYLLEILNRNIFIPNGIHLDGEIVTTYFGEAPLQISVNDDEIYVSVGEIVFLDKTALKDTINGVIF